MPKFNKAEKPGGPRFDLEQTDEERRDIDNLVLMCPIHHGVIDADVESYTVERLQRIKAQHETANIGGPEPSDELVNQLLLNIESHALAVGRDQVQSIVATGDVRPKHSAVALGFQPIAQYVSGDTMETLDFLLTVTLITVLVSQPFLLIPAPLLIGAELGTWWGFAAIGQVYCCAGPVFVPALLYGVLRKNRRNILLSALVAVLAATTWCLWYGVYIPKWINPWGGP